MSLHQNNKFFLAHGKCLLVSYRPPASENAKLLLRNFVEVRVVAGRIRKQEGRPHIISRQPMLIHTCHAVPMLCQCCAHTVALRSRFQKGMVVARHGRSRGMTWQM
jgi:hypothetical protein